jgi:hypothetical protein
MGIRGEIFSKKVLLQNRSYFFNVKENRKGDLYLNIVESKNKEEGGFERQSVVLFAEDLQEFLRGFDESLRVLEKEVREKRRAARGGGTGARDSGVRDTGGSPRDYKRDRDGRPRSRDGQDDVPFKAFRKK